MAIQEIKVSGYRSIQKMRLRLSRCNVIVGPNGCGKSNLYRSLYLLTQAASGRLGRALADEGGMPSVLWAGQRKKGPVRLTVSVVSDQFSYELSCGLPPLDSEFRKKQTVFGLNPEIKEETVGLASDRRVHLLERKGVSVWARNAEGKMLAYPGSISMSETALSQLREPNLFPELFVLRDEILSWRFFHRFPTDTAAPARHHQLAVYTPMISDDGCDLVSALQTIREYGRAESDSLDQAIDRLIPGAALLIEGDSYSRLHLELSVPGVNRPLQAQELSDGTMQYLYLTAALLSPRPPRLIALNEPETSLHVDMLEPLARLVADASTRSQMWIVTHSDLLARHIANYAQTKLIALHLVDGETRLVDESLYFE